MFTLESLHLENFGAIRESTFTPKESELTSIYGANGNGKSSFLDAIVWALFGVIPKDRKQTEIRNFYAEEKREHKSHCHLQARGRHNHSYPLNQRKRLCKGRC